MVLGTKEGRRQHNKAIGFLHPCNVAWSYGEERRRRAIGFLVGGFTPKPLNQKKEENNMHRNRSHQVSFRLSDDEFQILQYKLSQCKMNKTNFFIFAIRNQRIIVVEDYIQVLAELKRQGNNLNQIAHRFNQYIRVPDEEILSTLHDCRACYQKLYQISDKISNVGG